jgi:acetyltransferase-like isoleucine patch superfamily enzyme
MISIYSLFNKVNKLVERVFFKTLGSQYRIRQLRRWGVKVGEDCLILNDSFDSEPYLIEIGNHVAIASGVRFITHDGGVWSFRNKFPELDCFGKIKIGDNCFIGLDAIILPDTEIGNNCVVGAGSVVKGKIPDDSVVMGNPAKIIMKSSFLENLYTYNRNSMNTKLFDENEKRKILTEHFKLNSNR